MAVVAYHRERTSGSSPRSFLTDVDMGTAPTGVVVILQSSSSSDDFNGCRIGGTSGAVDGTGYTSASFNLTNSGVSGSGLRVFSYFGAGIPTGVQSVHYSKTSENDFVLATILVFDSETGIGTPTIHAGATPIAVTKSGTTSGRKVYLAGRIDPGSGNAVTPTGGTDTPVLDINGSLGRGVVLTKDAAGTSTTLNGTTAASNYWMAAFEVVAGASDPIPRPNSDVTTTGWSVTPSGSFYAAIDEATFSDTDFITSPTITGSTAPITLGLSNGPLAAGTYVVGVRANTSSGTATLRVYLLNDSNVSQGVTADQTINTTATTYSLPITTTGSATRVRIEVVS